MKRFITLVFVISAAVLSPFSVGQMAAQRQAPAPDVNALEVIKVRDNLFVIKGGGGNGTVFINSKGVVLVDVKSPGWGKPLLEKVKTLTDKPVITVINTHSHPDHCGGNVDMPAGVDIITSENTKKNIENMEFFKKPENARGIPNKTFKDKMTLFSGPDEVDLYFFGPGETGGDTMVVFPGVRVMDTGDTFAQQTVSVVNTNNGGSPVKLPDTLANAANTVKGVDTVITGHDGIVTFDDLKTYATFHREFLAFVLAEKKAGKTVDEVTADYKIPDKYVGYMPADARRVRLHIQGIYDELGGKTN